MAEHVVAEVKEQVRGYLVGTFTVTPLQTDVYLASSGSARCVVMVTGGEADERVFVSMSARVARHVPESPELLEHVARTTDSWVFGHLALKPEHDGPGTAALSVVHRLLANYLDEEELVAALSSVLATADEVGDDLRARFGGEAPGAF